MNGLAATGNIVILPTLTGAPLYYSKYTLEPELVTMYTRLIRLGLSVDTVGMATSGMWKTYYAEFMDIIPNTQLIIQFTLTTPTLPSTAWRPTCEEIKNITHIEVSYINSDNTNSTNIDNLYDRENEHESFVMEYVATNPLTPYNKDDIAIEVIEFIEDYLE